MKSLVSFLLLMALSVQAEFLSDVPEYSNFAQKNYVDVFWEYEPYASGNAGIFSSGPLIEVARGKWDQSEAVRKRVICKSNLYTLITNVEHPGVDEIRVGSDHFLAKDGIFIEVITADGIVYSSRHSPVKARQNTWRAGYHYYDAHLLDFKLASTDGKTLPVTGEFVVHAFPDKVHVEARLSSSKIPALKSAKLVGKFTKALIKKTHGHVLNLNDVALGVVGGVGDDQTISVDLIGTDILSGHLAFFPGSDVSGLDEAMAAEANPLSIENFSVSDGLFLGYDAASGLYRLANVCGSSVDNFDSFYQNPNMYLTTGVKIKNDDLKRKLYFQFMSTGRSVESALLTDSRGFPLPVAVQAAKNFGSEKEEPDDTPFNESYFAVHLESSEYTDFNTVHLHQNWGNHALRQVSSIRFFQLYYHLSHGTTETTCFSLPTKFGHTPKGEPRSYALADYRPLSGETWTSQPQHHHVSLEGWLQYLDAEGNFRYPVFKGSKIYSSGPNLAWFTLDYISSDGKVDQHLDIFEMPQADETRTHVRLRYTFNKDVEIAGDIAKNMRLINKGSYIRQLTWSKLAWLDAGGIIKYAEMKPTGDWAVVGEEVRSFNSFFCGYPHMDGNPGLVLRQVSGTVNGKPFSRVGFSAIAHEDNKAELMLVPLLENNKIKKGSTIDIDCILLPYGNIHSNEGVPYHESIRFGLNRSEFDTWKKVAESTAKAKRLHGPVLEVHHGDKVMNYPPFVKVKNNFASMRFSGGHDRVSLIASGFSHREYPMLWADEAYLDFQVLGHDGIQSFENQDGTFGFIFNPKVRTTFVGGKCRTRAYNFHTTQALSESGIKSISHLNGRVKIEQKKAGEMELISPRLWCPAKNVVVNDSLNSMQTSEQIIETVPMRIIGDEKPENIEIESYQPEQIKLSVLASNKVQLSTGGLYPNTTYIVRIGKVKEEIRSKRDGWLTFLLPLPPNQPPAITKVKILKK